MNSESWPKLEESLSKQDPRFAKNVRETNVYSHGGRRVRWGIAGFIAGLVILILCFFPLRCSWAWWVSP